MADNSRIKRSPGIRLTENGVSVSKAKHTTITATVDHRNLVRVDLCDGCGNHETIRLDPQSCEHLANTLLQRALEARQQQNEQEELVAPANAEGKSVNTDSVQQPKLPDGLVGQTREITEATNALAEATERLNRAIEG